MSKSLVNAIENLEDYVKKLETVVNIDSGTTDTQGVTKVAKQFVQWFSDIGFYAEEVSFDDVVGHGVFATNDKNAEHYDLLLSGHIDTVFAHGTAEERPFKRDVNLAYGPGVADMKDGDLIILWGLTKALVNGTLEGKKVAVVLNPDEETGSTHSSEFIDSIAKKSDYALIFEGSEEIDNFTEARKGISHIDIFLKGRGAHAGFCPEKGRSAINAMANCIQRINALANENVTVNFGVLKGGTIANAIAEDCYARIDIRFWNNDQWEDFLAKFKHEFEIPFGQDIQASFKILLVNPAMVVTEKAAKLKEIVTKALTKFSITPKFIRSGGVSDGNHISNTGTPVLDTFGGRGGECHTTREWLDLTSVEPRAELLVEILKQL